MLDMRYNCNRRLQIDCNSISYSDFSPHLFLPKLLADDLDAYLESIHADAHLADNTYLLFDRLCSGLAAVFKDNRILNSETHENSWVCFLMGKLLHRICGDSYTDLIERYISLGFMGRSRTYQKTKGDVKGHAKAFWLSPKYATYFCSMLRSRWKMKTGECNAPFGSYVTYAPKSKTAKRRLYIDEMRRKEHVLEKPENREIYDNLAHFSVDMDKAKTVLSTLAQAGDIHPDRVGEEMKKAEVFNRMREDPVAAYVIEDRFGRIHTNVTQFKRELRDECLKCDGKPVGSVDIKSSQAAFLCGIFRDWISLASGNGQTLARTFVTLKPFWNASESITVAEKMRSEYGKFTELLRNGRIYEYFGERVGTDEPRSIVKMEWLAFLFAPVRMNPMKHPLRSRMRHVWATEFPTLLGCIDSMKLDNYAALAYEMQRTESDFVFNMVFPTVRRGVGCPVCTVHDSLIVPAENVGVVERMMNELLSSVDVPTMTKAEHKLYEPQASDLSFVARVLDEVERDYGRKMKLREMTERERRLRMLNTESEVENGKESGSHAGNGRTERRKVAKGHARRKKGGRSRRYPSNKHRRKKA